MPVVSAPSSRWISSSVAALAMAALSASSQGLTHSSFQLKASTGARAKTWCLVYTRTRHSLSQLNVAFFVGYVGWFQ
jgi:hypothetical protein